MAWNVFHAAEILISTIRVLTTKYVEGISAKEDRCRSNAHPTISFVAALDPYFGYAAAAEIARESVKTGRSLAETAPEKNLLAAGTLREILDPMRMTTIAAPIKQTLQKAKRKTRKSQDAAGDFSSSFSFR